MIRPLAILGVLLALSAEIAAVGVFNTPEGADGPGVLEPGAAYELSFEAEPGAHLSFATMFVHSNDWFYAPEAHGIPLFEGMDRARSGDITSAVHLWDAGTEIDEAPGMGDHQAPRQMGPDMGAADPDRRVRRVDPMMHHAPPTAEALRVTLTPEGDAMGGAQRFTLRIENLGAELMSGDMMGPAILLAPGVWVVHSPDEAPLFTEGARDRGEGLEALAEDGDPSGLAAMLKDKMMMM